MDGYQQAIEALEKHPDLKVLSTSGFTRRREVSVNVKKKIASDLAKSLLPKPYNISELATAVRGALD